MRPTRHSAMVKTPGLKTKNAFEKRKLRKEAIDRARSADSALRTVVKEEKIAKKEKTKAKRELKEENEKKSMVYQRITNTSKIKKMSKKQLRHIQKA